MCGLGLLRCPTDVGDVAFGIVVVGHDVVESRAVVLRGCAACAVEFDGGIGGTLSSGVVKTFSVDVDVGGVGMPVHLQSGEQPCGVGFALCKIMVDALALLWCQTLCVCRQRGEGEEEGGKKGSLHGDVVG